MFPKFFLFLCSILISCLAMPVKAHAFFDWFSSLSPKAKRAQKILEGFDAKIEQALKDFDVPGLSIGIVVDGDVVLAKGYGMRDLERNLPVTSDTIFGIGSCTKAFSTFAIGTLIEEGLMEWDQPVCDILPEFCLSSQYATRNVTIRDLVTHRSGMARHAYMWYNSKCSRQELLKRLRYLEPACDIRERYIYGDLMYMVAGLAVEKVTQQSWENVISEKILKPLEMKRTNFSVADSKRDEDHAIPYVERNGTIRRMSFRDFSVIGAGGSINSTAHDLTHWLKMLLAQGVYSDRPLLSTTGLQEMFAGQVIVSGYAESKELLLNAYGLGWGIHSYRGHYHVSHDGGLDGFTSVVGVLPYDGIGIVVLANKNLSSLPRLIAFETLDRILELPLRDWLKEGLEQIQNGKKAALENQEAEGLQRKKGTTPSHSLEEYIGEYDHPGYGRVKVELKEGKLTASYNDITSVLAHWHYDVFSIVEDSEDLLVSREGTKFTFRNNLNGDVEELLIPFEPKTDDIVFKKVPDEQFSNLGYFRQFLGLYEIYNITVEIMIRDRTLVAIVPGQPIFELVPLLENEFSVKSMTSYNIRFVKGIDGQVEEVWLVLPYGAYSAKKINNR
jgi:CubicO group peptidase (beta-lactamase class C family)